MEISLKSKVIMEKSRNLTDVSKKLRAINEEISAEEGKMLKLTELDGCRKALKELENALTEATAKTVDMASALGQIEELYENAEEKAAEAVSGGRSAGLEYVHFQGITSSAEVISHDGNSYDWL